MSKDAPQSKIHKDYFRSIHIKVLFILLCVAISLVALGTSVTIGARALSMSEVYAAILDHLRGIRYEQYSDLWYNDYVVWYLRMPRAVFAVVAGAGLAIAGAAMQSLMKNPLADAYTTGVSSGACFGMAVSTAIGFSIMGVASGLSVSNAIIFSLIPTMIMVFIAPKEKISPATLILVGQALSYLFNALTTVLLSMLEDETLAKIYEWEVGTFKYITWDSVTIPFFVTLAGSIVLILLSRKLNVISLGDSQATALGLNVENLRIVLLFISSIIVASIIAYAGIIGFVGLVAPHIVRMIIGSDNRFLIPASAAFGATFLLVCDMLTRMISDVDAVPIGIIISFIGAPIFLYLIIRQRRSIW